MVEINVVYAGDLRCVATHQPSGVSLQTDAPVDNMGRGESFSPTDLLATALATCILTTMAIVARRHGIELTGAKAQVVKGMVSQPARRVGQLTVVITLPIDLPADRRESLEAAGRNCPVYKSLHPDIELPLRFDWGVAVHQ